ncbi:MAG: NYN domain-containing protein [Treponemataceae bacterium]|nr:NYN domain-containing protein [Treponemataceae bacterium]
MKRKPLTAVLWDVENVAPKQTGSIIERIEEDYKIAYALAFADWTMHKPKEKCEEFAKHNFEMIHTPHISGIKNTADISMVTHGLNILNHYPNIEHYTLLTGDADFRPLLMELTRAGKSIRIICDAKNASVDLVSMADEYTDYRDIIEDAIPAESGDDTGDGGTELSSEAAFALLEETVATMTKSGRSEAASSGSVKTRIKLLNPDFDEEKLGYSSWKNFVREAEKHTSVRFVPGDNTKLMIEGTTSVELPPVFKKLCAVIKELEKSWDEKGYIDFSQVAPKVNSRSFGYTQFKRLALEAEKRGLVKVHSEDSAWLIKLL